eukprot:scaffold59972_cov68-Attheya_sp.AAC.3
MPECCLPRLIDIAYRAVMSATPLHPAFAFHASLIRSLPAPPASEPLTSMLRARCSAHAMSVLQSRCPSVCQPRTLGTPHALPYPITATPVNPMSPSAVSVPHCGRPLASVFSSTVFFSQLSFPSCYGFFYHRHIGFFPPPHTSSLASIIPKERGFLHPVTMHLTVIFRYFNG